MQADAARTFWRRLGRRLAMAVPWLPGMQPRFRIVRGGRVTIGRNIDGLHHASFAGRNAVGRDTTFAGSVEVGFGTTIGIGNMLYGPLTIGNYCQFGPAVAIYGRDHPTSYVTTYINRALFDGRLNEESHISQVIVGHDVWIGHGAVLLRGASVGNGAVIGAGAIVRGHVPDYAIVAGNPAKVIRYRIPPETIRLLNTLAWWTMSPDDLQELEPLFHIDLCAEPERAIEMLSAAIAEREQGRPHAPKPMVPA